MKVVVAGESYDETMLSEEHARKVAGKKGLAIEYPAPNELQVDIDGQEQYVKAMRCLANFQEMAPGIEAVLTPSSSCNPYKFHLRVLMEKDVTLLERIFYQALLGSDPLREALSFRRLLLGETRPTLFFEKVAAGKTE